MTTYFYPLQHFHEFHRRRLIFTVNGMVAATAAHIEEQMFFGNGSTSFPMISWTWMEYFVHDAQHHNFPITKEVIIFAVYFTLFLRVRSRFAGEMGEEKWCNDFDTMIVAMEDFNLE